MNVVIYARYSSHAQNEQSIDAQIRVCKEYAQKNGFTVVGEYKDYALSGKTDNRPDFQRMIADSSKHLFEGVLLWKTDRFGRNKYDAAVNKKKLKDNGARVISVTENIPEGPEGVILESMLEGMAEYYSLQLSENVKRGQAESAKKCQTIGSRPGLGFKVGDDKRFVIDKATAPIVQEIFSMYVNGKTVNEIITTLNERHILTSQGNPFNKNSLHRMFRNKRYIGIYTYNGEETPGGMPRIIDDETFYQVQEMLDKNKKAPARARAKAEYLLTANVVYANGQRKSKIKILKAVKIQRDIKVNENFNRLPFIFGTRQKIRIFLCKHLDIYISICYTYTVNCVMAHNILIIIT